MATYTQFLDKLNYKSITLSNSTANDNSKGKNNANLVLFVDTKEAYISSESIGTGEILPLAFKNNKKTVLSISPTGNIIINTSALSTNATAGFLWVPSCNGVPLGNPPAPYPNAAALLVDTLNDNLVIRSGTKWVTSAKLTGDNSSLAWRALTSDISVKTVGTSDPLWTNFKDNIYGYSYSANIMNQAWMTFNINHDYAMGTPVYIHFHWSTAGTDVGVCRWGVEWTIAKGHQQSTFNTTHSYYVEQSPTGTPYTHMISETSAISSTELEPGSLILVRLFRDATNKNDTLSDAAFLFSVNVLYQSDRVGTPNRLPNFYN